MGEARRRIQAEINLMRPNWAVKIKELQHNISLLEAVEEPPVEGDSYYEFMEDFKNFQEELFGLSRLSAMTDRQLRKMYSNRGYIG
jgi:hypothetical protein